MAMLHLTFVADQVNKKLLRSISSRLDLAVLAEDYDDYEKMAETSQQQQQQPPPQQQQEELPQTNGAVDGLTEEEKSKMRPADIDADMREMERRKRVEMMMNSRLFREELERIIETQMKDGQGPSGLLQQISEMMGHQGARFNGNVFKNSNCVVPINDIRGVESMGYAKGEKLLRCKLAAVFRLLDLYGWTQGVGGMITARLNQDQEHFLVNPYGLLYHEVTASSLVKVDMQGNVVEQGTTNFGVHVSSYQLHSTIHAARPDLKVVVHIATPSVTAISSSKCSLLPLSQESIVIGEVSTHQYIGTFEPEEREKLSRNLGPINKVLMLTNRGALCCGETVEEAFFNVYNTVLACETQLKLMPVGIDNLVLITDEARKAIYEASRKAPVPQQQSSSAAESSALAEKLEKRWRIGGTDFEALMRMLDNAGFRTGYIYRHPLVKTEPPRPRNDVEVPPAVSSLGYLLEEEELYKQGLWKGGRKGTDRTRWLNSPNVYQKVEILETGTPDPKKITKWVSDGSPTHSSTPVKIDGALQFVPKNTNPKEFKQLQQQIKDYRRADKISAGPQSHILEGVTWEEAKKMQDATISGTGEQVVLVGAASKGIIQRGFQHNAMVYKTPYAKNPFDAVTDQELDQYKKDVERKTKGDIYDESQSESEALSSFNISRATHESSTAKSPVQSPVSVTSETEEESRDEPKVLRIETKQVPAPSQPEVVLSDERSVILSVVENSVAQREDIKSEPVNAQVGISIKTVNADFLNEQRRSEMMTRNRNANGRGMSGVSTLSSSQSHSSDEFIWRPFGTSRTDNNDACRLERTRSQELARPMKPLLLAHVQSVSDLKNRIRRAKFLENYDNVIQKHNLHSKFKSESALNCMCINTLKFENDYGKSNKYKDKDDILDTEKQLELDAEITFKEIKYSKSASINFAEKINLTCDGNFIDHNNCYEDNKLRSPTLVKMNMKRWNSDESVFSTPKRSLNNIFDKFSNQYNDNINNNKNLIKKDLSNSDGDETIKECTYVNGIELYIDNNELHHNSILEHEKYMENNNNIKCETLHNNNIIDNVKPDIENSKSEKTVIYSSEVAIFVPDERDLENSEDKRTTQNSSICSIKNEPLKIENFVFSSIDRKSLSLLDNKNDNNSENLTFENFKEESFLLNQSTPIETENSLELTFQTSTTASNQSTQSDETVKLIDNTKNTSSDSLHHRKRRSKKHLNKSPTKDSSSSSDEEECLKQKKQTQLKKVYQNFHPDTFEFSFSELERNSDCLSSASRGSFFSDDELLMKRAPRRDSIFEVVNSINANMKPSSRLTLESIRDTQVSKYVTDLETWKNMYTTLGIDIQDLSINNDSFEEVSKDTKEERQEIGQNNTTEAVTSTNNVKQDFETCKANCNDVVNNQQINNEDEDQGSSEGTMADNEDIIWIELSKNQQDVNTTVDNSEVSFLSNTSNEASDILELSSETFQEVKKSSDEIFHKNISSSVDEIISEIKDASADVISPSVAMLNVPRDVTKCSEVELVIYAEKIAVMEMIRKIVKNLVRNLPCYGDELSIHSKVSSSEENILESPDQSIYVIREIIHHIVDSDSLDIYKNKSKIIVTNKEVKESMNKELLKNLKDDYDVEDEKSLKCSTPKDLLSPCRSRNDSCSEEQVKDDYDAEDEKSLNCSIQKDSSSPCPSRNNSFSEDHPNQITAEMDDEKNYEIVVENVIIHSEHQQNLDPVVLSNSSPSTESQNSAEQEITTESTYNDTKSDSSKEKQTDSSESPKSPTKSSIDQLDCKISSDSFDPNLKENYKVYDFVANKKLTFCSINCEKEPDFIVNEENEEILQNKQEGEDSNSDSDLSMKEIMQTLTAYQEEINHMWEHNEAVLEEMYTHERLNDLSAVKSSCDEADEEVNQIYQQFNANEESTSFICYDAGEDESTRQMETHMQFEKVDETCPCCLNVTMELQNEIDATEKQQSILNVTQEIQNARSNSLSPIDEKPELELDDTCPESSARAVDSFETLPPIFDEPWDFGMNCSSNNSFENATESDSHLTDYYSCQNTASLKSYDEQETASSSPNPTSAESHCRPVCNVNMPSNNDISLYSSAVCPSDSTISEDIESNDQNFKVTDNSTDDLSNSSLPNSYETFTLECYSFSTKKFLELEQACIESDYAGCNSDYDFSLASLFDDSSNIVYESSSISGI